MSNDPKVTRVLSDDSHEHAINTQSPIFNIGSGLILIGCWTFANIVSITATQNAVLALLQTGMQLPPQLVPQQVLSLIQGSLDRNTAIAATISWGIQAYLFICAFPSDRAFLLVHRKYNAGKSATKTLAHKAASRAKLKEFFMWLCIAIDIACDAFYAAVENVPTPDGIITIANLANGGVLVAVAFTVVQLAGSMFLGPEGFHRLDAGLSELFRRQPKEA